MLYNEKVVNDFINRIHFISKVSQVYIFGAGFLGKSLGSFLNFYKIRWEGFIDNNLELKRKTIESHRVFSLQDINNIHELYILIAVSTNLYLDQVNQIKTQLMGKGVSETVIECISFNWEMLNAMDYILCDGQNSLRRNTRVKNIFQGKRCFVIGNGPSLTLNDLDILSEEITFSCNNSMQLWDKTMWRPTCFWGADHLFIDKNVNTEEKLQYILSNCQYMFTSFRGGLFEKYHYKYDNLLYLYLYRTNQLAFSEEISEKTYSIGSSIFVLLQIAVYMGVTEIYLVGCDYSFRNELKSNGKLVVNHNVQTHMKNMDQSEEGRYCVEAIMEEYLCAKNYAESHGIKIYNATRGGKLEVFERVDFDTLF